MEIKPLLSKLIAREPLTTAEAEAAFRALMGGELTPGQIGGLLIGLATKGESVDEITGAVTAMRAHAVPLAIRAADAIDTCGTGGDAQHTFNVSTAAAVIASSAGVTVAKHGNRAMSGVVGAADVLEAVGVRVDLTPEAVARCIDEVGIGFVFAPTFHPAMRHAGPVRRELGVRTIFNLLGPMSNPAGVRRQVIGVFSERWLEPIARVLQRLGSVHVLVVHGVDGVDEISPAAKTCACELRDGEIRTLEITPEDMGMRRCSLADIRIRDLAEAVSALRTVLDGQPGPLLEVSVLNAGAALYVAGRADTIAEGIAQARAVVHSGAARAQLQRLVEASQR